MDQLVRKADECVGGKRLGDLILDRLFIKSC
jgi:hypothetical protein